jgi:hypothetical protein
VDGPRRGDVQRTRLPEVDFEAVRFLIKAGVVTLVREGAAMLKVVPEESDPNATSESAASLSPPDEIVRDGARQMLATALLAEVAACVEQFRDEVVDPPMNQEATRKPRDTPIIWWTCRIVVSVSTSSAA